MKNSEIVLNIELDDQNIPETIQWNATEKPVPGPEYTNAIALSVWDNNQNNTLRMDLWTKDMSVDDMKRFCVDSIGGLAQSIKNATGDTYMAEEMESLCRKLVKHLEAEMKNR